MNKSLLQDPDGQRLSYFALRSRFDKAREVAGVDFQFRDLRAKAATDTGDLAHAQRLLGHKNRSTTEIYTRDRKGGLGQTVKKEELIFLRYSYKPALSA